MKKIIFIALGLLAISIGALARFVPGVPTTPFLLLALYCFNRSSERLSAWLRGTYLYKKYLENYIKSRSMTLKQKLTIQIFASFMMAASFIAVENLVFRTVIVALFIVHHYVFIFGIKTYMSDVENEKRLQCKRLREKDMLSKMVSLYCRKKHCQPRKTLCPNCSELLEYAISRCEHCPYMETKTSCKRCRTPCYKSDMRDMIRTVMRWSGPRMVLYHPIRLIGYVIFRR